MEIDEIEQKVVKEREKYKQVTQTKPDALTLVPNIEINDKVLKHQLDKEIFEIFFFLAM
jgi:hypothetical protein